MVSVAVPKVAGRHHPKSGGQASKWVLSVLFLFLDQLFDASDGHESGLWNTTITIAHSDIGETPFFLAPTVSALIAIFDGILGGQFTSHITQCQELTDSLFIVSEDAAGTEVTIDRFLIAATLQDVIFVRIYHAIIIVLQV